MTRKPSNYQKEYYAKHRERRIAESRANQVAHAAERKAYLAEYYLKNKEQMAEQRKEYRARTLDARKLARKAEYAADPEKFKKAAKEWQAANPEKRRRQRLKKYGITLEEFNAMMEQQGHACAICGHTDREQPLFFPVVDHCHKSAVVRGILCMNCNQGLGKFKDNVALLRAAVKYLQRKKV